ncbi:MAG TPA: hypothetical protein GX528_02825 [Firmicutes bacterium]|nr:hypothetical protein [Bacillota bacterium]
MNQVLGKVIAIAFLVEILTNSVKNALPKLDRTYLPLIAGIFGVALSWTTGIGILASLQIPIRNILLDYLITGVIISRGANIVHDLAKTLSFSG